MIQVRYPSIQKARIGRVWSIEDIEEEQEVDWALQVSTGAPDDRPALVSSWSFHLDHLQGRLCDLYPDDILIALIWIHTSRVARNQKAHTYGVYMNMRRSCLASSHLLHRHIMTRRSRLGFDTFNKDSSV